MAAAHEIAVVPPDPSFPTDTYKNYKPFDDDFEKTLDHILAEEQSLEDSRASDWPFYLGAEQDAETPRSGVSYEQDINGTSRSPVSTRSNIYDEAAKQRKAVQVVKKRSIATRKITIVDLCSEDEQEELDGPMLSDSDCHGQLERQAADTSRANTAVGESPPDNVHTDSAGPSCAVNGRYDPVGKHNGAAVESANGLINGDGDGQGGGDVDASACTSTNPSVKPSDSTPQDDEEEWSIFRTVKRSTKRRILRYIAAHPFMSQSIQPVRRSERQQFIKDMVTESVTLGLDPSLLWDLIMYVRRLYLQRVGVEAVPIADGTNDPCFGQEVDDLAREPSTPRKAQPGSYDGGSARQQHKKDNAAVCADRESSEMQEAISTADDSPAQFHSARSTLTFTECPDQPAGELDCSQPTTPSVRASTEDARAQGKYTTPESTAKAPTSSPSPILTRSHQSFENARVADSGEVHDVGTVGTDGQADMLSNSLEDAAVIYVQAENTQASPKARKDVAISGSDIGALEPSPLLPPQLGSSQIPDSTSPNRLSTQRPMEDENSLSSKMSKTQKRKARRLTLKKAQSTVDGMQASCSSKAAGQSPIESRNNSTHATDPHQDGGHEPLSGVFSCSALGPADEGNDNSTIETDQTAAIAAQSMSKNQKRKERKRVMREKKQLKYQQKKARDSESQRQGSQAVLHDKSACTERTPIFPSQRLAMNPEPRKEKKRKDREQKREQKRERKRKRESLKVELSSNHHHSDREHGDPLSNREEPDVEAHSGMLTTSRGKKQKLDSRRKSLSSLADNALFASKGSTYSSAGRLDLERSSKHFRKQGRSHRELSVLQNYHLKTDNLCNSPRKSISQIHMASRPKEVPNSNAARRSSAASMLTPISRSAGCLRSHTSDLSPDAEEPWDTAF
ncbi:hypothetical protein N7539_002812 [Penicillium diatomitis]|uniref:Uncharacterized protein n=1 Tax=Penicillium diatomitis TaxID=2819901 RepID=A0A9X0BYZ5_9EURO|nr:uncharacterized protein N7539_002812 [Penicillium diatomitis]KAJ5491245.1 hypothetical protein N7539_002812 [Penicillium diatomitis]